MANQTDDVVVQLFREQQSNLEEVRKLDYNNPDFKFWHDTTTNLFQRFVRPDSPHFVRFRDIRFLGQTSIAVRRLPYGYRGPVPRQAGVGSEHNEQFAKGCSEAENCIKGAIDEITMFGLHADAPKVKPGGRGGIQQTFHGPVTIENQVGATDHAIQNIGSVGDKGLRLKEVADLLNSSLDLTGRERLEALKCVELIASESAKPESQRNWKSTADWGAKLLDIANKAADMGTKLAPYLPALVELVHRAGSTGIS